ncbi:MAG: hypothetical protein H0X51_07980 [Parachlamydiaceae bacterium]|nr:hypothetical protein [Parachlamydiaceae bacterium]
MQAKSLTILRVLLNHFHQSVREPLLRCLPPNEASEVLAQETASNHISAVLNAPQELVQRMHYSWLRPALEKLPPLLQGSALTLLSAEQFDKLLPMAPEANPEVRLSEPMRAFVFNTFYKKLGQPTVLPLPFLPQTPLMELTKWNKTQLVELIQFLGIHDLASEVRHIIDKGRLKQLSPCLSAKQKQYLHICLHHPEKLAATPFGLSQWDGDCKKLTSQLHRRGMLRLSRALSGHHPDFVWHIAHILDIGRGSLLLQQFSPKAIVGVSPILVQQIINLMTFLQTKKDAHE